MLTPHAAMALSCKAQNFAEAFNRVAAAPEIYSLVHGTFQPADGADPDALTTELTFDGRIMGGSGFGPATTLPVSLARACLNNVCGAYPAPGVAALAFLEHTPDGYRLSSKPCDADFHLGPSLGRVSAIRHCMTEGACGPDEIAAFDLNAAPAKP